MRQVFRPLYRETLFFSLKCLGGSIAILLCAWIFGFPPLAAVALLGPGILVMFTLALPSLNLSWLLSLPISKQEIMVQSFVYGIFGMSLSGLMATVIDVLIEILEHQKTENWSFSSRFYSFLLDAFHGSVSLGTLALILVAILLVPTILLPRQAASAVAGSPKSGVLFFGSTNVSASAVVYGLGGATAVILLTFGFLIGVVNAFFLILLFTLLLPGLMLASSMHAVGFSRELRKRWWVGFVTVSLFGNLCFFLVAQGRLRDSGSANARFEAADCLGFFSGRSSYRGMLEEFLPEDLAPETIHRLVSSYGRIVHLSLFFRDWYWLNQNESNLKFQDLIRKKSDRKALIFAGTLFDPRSLGKEDMVAYLEKVKTLKGTEELPPNIWVNIPLTDVELEALLRSDSVDEISVGLAYVRFHPSAKFAELIRKRIARDYPDGVLPQALMTLAVLKRTDLGMRGVASVSTQTYRDAKVFDCANFAARLKDVRDPQEGNQCVRKLTLGKKFSSVSKADVKIYEFPLDDGTFERLSSVIR